MGVDCVTEVLPNRSLEIEEGTMRIGAMIDMLQNNVHCVEQLAPHLPAWLRERFESKEFVMECIEKFEAVDRDGSQRLEAEELFPVILEISEESPLPITEEHCER